LKGSDTEQIGDAVLIEVTSFITSERMVPRRYPNNTHGENIDIADTRLHDTASKAAALVRTYFAFNCIKLKADR